MLEQAHSNRYDSCSVIICALFVLCWFPSGIFYPWNIILCIMFVFLVCIISICPCVLVKVWSQTLKIVSFYSYDLFCVSYIIWFITFVESFSCLVHQSCHFIICPMISLGYVIHPWDFLKSIMFIIFIIVLYLSLFQWKVRSECM